MVELASYGKNIFSQCSALYGCPLWNIDDPNIELLCTAWKVCCRKILGIMPNSESMILHQVMNALPIKDKIMDRQLFFILSGIYIYLLLCGEEYQLHLNVFGFLVMKTYLLILIIKPKSSHFFISKWATQTNE